MSKVVAMISGGMESALLMYRLRDSDVIALIFNCWQDGEEFKNREINLAMKQAKRYRKKYEIIDVSDINGKMIDEDSPESYVPGFQLIMTSIALSYAESKGAEVLARGDTHCTIPGYRNNQLYKEGRKIIDDLREGLVLVEQLYERLYDNRVHLWFPFYGMDKADIVRDLLSNGIQDNSHCSCVESMDSWEVEDGINHCGNCFNCSTRREGYKLAKKEDKTKYREGKYNLERYKEG